MAGAVREMQEYVNFDYIVINDDFNQALNELQSIVCTYRLQVTKQSAKNQQLISDLLS